MPIDFALVEYSAVFVSVWEPRFTTGSIIQQVHSCPDVLFYLFFNVCLDFTYAFRCFIAWKSLHEYWGCTVTNLNLYKMKRSDLLSELSSGRTTCRNDPTADVNPTKFRPQTDIFRHALSFALSPAERH